MHRDVHLMDVEFNFGPFPQVEDINLSSGNENNFHIYVRVSE